MNVRKLMLADIEAAAGVLGRGMRDNPMHIAAWRGDSTTRQRALTRFFRPAVRGLLGRGEILGAFDNEALVGVCGLTPPGCCQPSGREKVRVLPSLLLGHSPGVMLRVLRWTGAWGAHDLAEPHWHLGPVAVDLPRQGQGIGSRMLSEFCQMIDRQRGVGYLETDKPENVRFYEKFGFVVVEEIPVLGIPNWFMRRPAADTAKG